MKFINISLKQAMHINLTTIPPVFLISSYLPYHSITQPSSNREIKSLFLGSVFQIIFLHTFIWCFNFGYNDMVV